jgi:hypothetical protein
MEPFNQDIFHQLNPPPHPKNIAKVLLLLTRGKFLDTRTTTDLGVCRNLPSVIKALTSKGLKVKCRKKIDSRLVRCRGRYRYGRYQRRNQTLYFSFNSYWLDFDNANLEFAFSLLVNQWGYSLPVNEDQLGFLFEECE